MSDLRAGDAPTSQGFAVMYPDGLCILSASTTEYRAMINGLYMAGIRTCLDPECDCAEKAFADMMPGCTIVPVALSVKTSS